MKLPAVLLLALLFPAAAGGEVEPVDFTIAAGEALYVEFEVDDPSAIYPDFHAFEADFKPLLSPPGSGSFTAVVSVFDPATDDVLGVSLPVPLNLSLNFSAFGPTFCDPDLAPDATHCASHPEAADLSSYGAGFGRVALENQSGDDFRVGGVELLYGRYAPGGSSGEFVKPAFAITDIFVPEPSNALLIGVAALALAGQSRRERRAGARPAG